MRKINYKQFYIAININSYSIHISSSKSIIANIINCHRNTIAKITDRTVVNNFIIEKITEQ